MQRQSIWYIIKEKLATHTTSVASTNGKTLIWLNFCVNKWIKDRPGHDRRYAIDANKINKELGWRPSVTFEEGLSQTIDWYLQNGEWLKHVTSGAYQGYYERMYGE